MSINERLKRLREALNLNRTKAAEQLGIPYTTYCNYENGYREPDSNTYKKIAQFYGVSVDYLIGNSNEETSGDLDVLLQKIKDRPGMGILFKRLDKATSEDILKTVEFLDNLLDDYTK